jgi:hypothetical protein
MMNSYYSNLIGGHNTRPLDIERALTGADVEPENADDGRLSVKLIALAVQAGRGNSGAGGAFDLAHTRFISPAGSPACTSAAGKADNS